MIVSNFTVPTLFQGEPLQENQAPAPRGSTARSRG